MRRTCLSANSIDVSRDFTFGWPNGRNPRRSEVITCSKRLSGGKRRWVTTFSLMRKEKHAVWPRAEPAPTSRVASPSGAAPPEAPLCSRSPRRKPPHSYLDQSNAGTAEVGANAVIGMLHVRRPFQVNDCSSTPSSCDLWLAEPGRQQTLPYPPLPAHNRKGDGDDLDDTAPQSGCRAGSSLSAVDASRSTETNAGGRARSANPSAPRKQWSASCSSGRWLSQR
jgi:hypothetical protein